MQKQLVFLVVTTAAVFNCCTAQAQQGFNPYIMKSVQMLYAERKGGGYDANQALTKDLAYGVNNQCCVTGVPHPKPPANNPTDHKSMCVGGIQEVIVEAINMYAQDHKNDPAALAKLPPIDFLSGSTKLDLRPYLYEYSGFQSSGTASALLRFKLGTQVPFAQLQPGSFINLNRTNGSGHAVVFLSFIDKDGNDLPSYSAAVKGFRDFTVQGEGSADAGFTYRWAYFDPYCPAKNPNKPRDCGVISSSNQSLLNTGYMYDPQQWPDAQKIQQILQAMRTDFLSQITTISPNAFSDKNPNKQLNVEQFDAELKRELPFSPNPKFSGITTD